MRISDLFTCCGRTLSVLGIAAALLASPVAKAAEPLHIGYSDWPGWVAWQVAIDKGWLKQAGKLDAVTCTNSRPVRPSRSSKP